VLAGKPPYIKRNVRERELRSRYLWAARTRQADSGVIVRARGKMPPMRDHSRRL
jgi:hypothetical protein